MVKRKKVEKTVKKEQKSWVDICLFDRKFLRLNGHNMHAIIMVGVFICALVLLWIGSYARSIVLDNKNKVLGTVEMDYIGLAHAITGYSNVSGQTDDTPDITSTGIFVHNGIVAVSQDLLNDWLSYGDLIYIPDLGIFSVQDTMARRWERTIDLFIPKEKGKLATKFGRVEHVPIYRLRNKNEKNNLVNGGDVHG